MLPEAWSLLGQIAQGGRRLHEFSFLTSPESGLTLSGVERAWDEFVHDVTDFPTDHLRTPGDSHLSTVDDRRRLLHLFGALAELRAVWQNEAEPSDLHAALAFTDHDGADAEIEFDEPALILQPGSLLATASWRARYTGSWVLGLLTRGVRVPSQIAGDVVQNLRIRATTAATLTQVRDAKPSDLTQRSGILIFVHGLMSTDAGLFDPLVAELRRDPAFASYLMLGFPHDTFTKIENNAGTLLDHVERLFENNHATPLAFVAHSRGGLVARQVAVSLYRQNVARWGRQVAGCVTFGTPHEGTPLAEYPSRLLGLGLLGIGITQPGAGFATASDVLALVRAYRGEIPGITDLLSPRALGTGSDRRIFISTLRDVERMFSDRFGRTLKIFAIGGRGPHDSRFGWVTDKIFRGQDHDCAVELSSSAHPLRIGLISHEVQSDHFSYFRNGAAVKEASAFLLARLREASPDYTIATQRPIRPAPKLQIKPKPDWEF